MVAWCHPGDVAGIFADSLFGLLLYDAREGGGKVLDRGGQISLRSGPRVAEARSQIVDAYLDGFDAADWLWFVDADMGFEPDALDRLLEVAHPERAPIVGGLCFAGGADVRQYPTLYRVTDETGAVEAVDTWPEGRLVKVDATGAACLLIHRQVLVSMLVRYGHRADGTPNPYPWFVEGMINQATGAPYGEDIAFCLRARALGIPIHVHTGVEIDHEKAALYNLRSFRLYQALQAQGGSHPDGEQSPASEEGAGGSSDDRGGERPGAGTGREGAGLVLPR